MPTTCPFKNEWQCDRQACRNIGNVEAASDCIWQRPSLRHSYKQNLNFVFYKFDYYLKKQYVFMS